MKKMIGVLLFLFVITGCGKDKNLSCVVGYSSETGDSSIREMNFVYPSNGKKAKSLTVRSIESYGSDYKEEDIQKIFEDSESTCLQYNANEGVECEITQSGNSITTTLTIYFDSLEDDLKDSVKDLYNVSYEDTKKDLEKEGYSCQE